MDIDKIKMMIDSHSIITFDVFDTLIKRIVNRSEDIFKFTERNFNYSYSKQSDFQVNRIKAERYAREKLNGREICLNDIYDQLNNIYTKDELKVLSLLEIKTEIEFSVGNYDIISLFNYAKSRGKSIFIISDMYLPETAIGKILEKNGIVGYQKIYVSSEYRKTKSSGELFKLFIHEQKVLPQDVMHIGDNKLADYKSPRKYGISACLIGNNENLIPKFYSKISAEIKNTDAMEYSVLNNYGALKIKGHYFDSNSTFRIGYQVFGPLLFGYTKWLIDQCRDKNIDTILFCSRDGYILKKCFDSLYDGKNIRTFYFHGSRKAIVTPNFQHDNSVGDMLKRYKSMPLTFDLDFILKKLGISKKDLISGADIINKNCDKKYSIKNLPDIEKLLAPNIFRIQQNSKEQAAFLLEYLDTLLTPNYHNVALVDIGGNRTIEKNLRYFLKHNNREKWNLYSFSLEMADKETSKSLAYLYAQNHDWYLYQLIMPFYYFMEIMLSAPHGSVKAYNKKGEVIYPQLGRYDYENDPINESKLFNLQRGILSFINDFSYIGSNYMTLNNGTCIQKLFAFGMTPEKKDLDIWHSFKFNADDLSPLIYKRKTIEYFIHPTTLFRDYQRSLWKSGFFSSLLHTSRFNHLIYKGIKLLHSILF